MLLLSRLPYHPRSQWCLRLPHLHPPPQLASPHLHPARSTCRHHGLHEPLLKQNLTLHQGCLPVRDAEEGVRLLDQLAVGVLVGLREGDARLSEVRELLIQRLEGEHRGTESSGRLEELLAYVSYFGFGRGHPQRCT